MKRGPCIKTYSMYALIILIVLALLTGVSMAYARDRLEPRLINTFYAGYRAIDRYIYGDVTIDVVYLNPKVYYSYRNAYVVPFKYIYTMPGPLPINVFKGIAINIIQKLRAIGVHANYVILNTYVLKAVGLNESVVVDRIESIDGVEYTIYDPSKGLLTKTREFSFSNYILIVRYNGNYFTINYVNLSESERLKAIKVIGEAFKQSNISNVTIAVFDERTLSLKNSYFIDTLKFDKNETLKNILIEAFMKAGSAFMEVNASCLVGGGGKFGGYWAGLEIRDTFDKCADAVIRFVNVYVDEIRRIVPEDIPIYIELEENAQPEYLLPERPSQQPLLIIVAIVATILTLVIAWRIARRRTKL